MATRREVSRREIADIEWQRERDCAKRKQRYLKHLRKIHKKKSRPERQFGSGIGELTYIIPVWRLEVNEEI